MVHLCNPNVGVITMCVVNISILEPCQELACTFHIIICWKLRKETVVSKNNYSDRMLSKKLNQYFLFQQRTVNIPFVNNFLFIQVCGLHWLLLVTVELFSISIISIQMVIYFVGVVIVVYNFILIAPITN